MKDKNNRKKQSSKSIEKESCTKDNSNVRFVPKTNHNNVVPSKKDKLDIIIYVWTLFSALYAIGSTCAFIISGWVDGVVSYVLVGILTFYIIIFIALLILTKDNKQKGKSGLKYFKTLIKLFKSLSGIIYIVLSAVSLFGVASFGFENLEKIIVFFATLFVAVVKFALKLTKFGIKLHHKRIGKKYDVKVSSYVDGESKKSITNKFIEKSYK